MVVRIWSDVIGQHEGERVRLSGWLHRLRVMGSLGFLVLRDARGTAQVVVEDPALLAELSACYSESVLDVEGTVRAAPQAPGGYELHNPAIRVISPAAAPPPVDLFRRTMSAQLPTILAHGALTTRHPQRRALFTLADASVSGFRQTLRAQGFTEIHTPKIVASATESGANVFQLDYFGTPAFLAQSPQFYKQTMVGVFERVYEIAPVFRAEPHSTTRHLNEYVSLDVEMGFIASHRDVMAMLASVLRGMLAAIESEASDAVALLDLDLPGVPADVPVIHFADALQMVSEATSEDVTREPDLAPSHERWLGEWALREYGSDFLFVEGYPMVKRPFYTHPDPARPTHSNSFDLLFRGVELVTGGQRLHLYADYLAVLEKRGMTADGLEGYLEAFKYGMPPHGGFAIGLERWVSQLARLNNVREATPFPRDLHRLTP